MGYGPGPVKSLCTIALKPFNVSIHARLTSVGLYLQGGVCLCSFDLVFPWFMSIHPYLRSLSLVYS